MTLSVEDRIEIQDLYSRYNYLVDIERNAAAMAGLFVEDGTYDHGRHDGILSGRDEIQAFMQRAVDKQEGKTQHWNANLLIDDTTDPVSAMTYILSINSITGEARIPNPPTIYRDTLVKTSDGWKFKSRRVGYPLPEQN